MSEIVYRQGKLFKIDREALPLTAQSTDVINALFGALHFEFRGASENQKYTRMTYQERMVAINQFAITWLNTKGYK